MSADSPRHGTDVGYSIGGCREGCCANAHRRAQKERALFRLRNGSCRFSQSELRSILDPWLRMGVSLHALAEAVGKCSDRLLTTDDVQRATFQAFAQLSEDDLLDSSTVSADLTRFRIYSLMAIGHRLDAMPITAKGAWRQADQIKIGSARAIRSYFIANESKIGPSTYTATRARNRGHAPPMAWDDPGTLAWPDGTRPKISTRATRPLKTDIDPVVVQRVLAGDRMPTTRAEKLAITARWEASGRTLKDLEHLMGWKSDRYTVREAS